MIADARLAFVLLVLTLALDAGQAQIFARLPRRRDDAPPDPRWKRRQLAAYALRTASVAIARPALGRQVVVTAALAALAFAARGAPPLAHGVVTFILFDGASFLYVASGADALVRRWIAVARDPQP